MQSKNTPMHVTREEARGGPLEPVMDLQVGPIVSDVVVTSASPSSSSSSGVGAASRVDTVTFEVRNATPAIANTLRRIMMTEVPTMAIDRVLVVENEGVVLDEVLCHRLGMIPIVAPVQEFEYVTSDASCSFTQPDPQKVIKFELIAAGAKDRPITPVYSSQLRFVPLPGQEALAAGAVALVHPDILIAKLGPGQRINVQAFALKGLGLTHAKWSPVAACYYDMHTTVRFNRAVVGDEARLLKKACPARVFDIEDETAVARRPRNCTMCRECVRVEHSFGDAVCIEKAVDRFIFTVESTGQHHAADIVRLGLRGFAERLRSLKASLMTTAVATGAAAATAAAGKGGDDNVRNKPAA